MITAFTNQVSGKPGPAHFDRRAGVPRDRGLPPHLQRSGAEDAARRRLADARPLTAANYRALTERVDALEPGSQLQLALLRRRFDPDYDG